MRNNNGKAGVVIIILAAIILVALVPWYFIIMRNFFDPDDRPETQTEGYEEAGHELPHDELPDHEPEYYPDHGYEDDPEDDYTHESEHGSDVNIPVTESVRDIASVRPQLQTDLNGISRQYNAMAVSMAMFDGDTGEYFTYHFGHADSEAGKHVDDDTKFRVASLAKLTTVICAMVLVDQELIDLDSDISIYLGYEVINTHYPGTAITVRMLMQHTSSIFDSGAFQVSRDRNSSESIRVLLERGASFRRSQPGTSFEYTNFGYAILGAICENVSQKTLDTFAREVLFDPLNIDAGYIPSKMKDTENIAVIYNDRHSVTRSVQSQLSVGESNVLGHDLHLAQGNLTISAIDYAKILAMLGNGGVSQGVEILSPQAVNEMHITNVTGAAYEQGLATRYSFGDFIAGEGFYWHTGSAYGLFAQYIYTATASYNRGIIVVTTGATTGREQNGMVSLCTDIAAAAWAEFNTLIENNDPDDLNESDNDD